MATSADIAVQSSNYTGNAQLGGAGGEALKFDLKPLEQLTAYTNLYNKARYDQKQKNADAAVKQLADLASINANMLWDKDKEYLTNELAGAIKQSNELLSNVPTNPEDLMKWQMKFQGIVKKVNDDYATGKQRSVAREAQIAHIRQTYKDPRVQDSMIAQLDKKLNDTDISTLLSAMPDFEPTVINIPKAVPQTFNTISTNGEDNVEVKGSFFSPRQSGMAVTQSLFNLKSAFTDPNSAKYQQMSETEKMAADVQNGVRSPIQTMEENANNFNSILLAKNPDGTPKYFGSDGKFNNEKFEADNSGNAIVMSVYKAAKDLDQYSRKKLGELSSGVYDDQGFKFNLPQTITKDEFTPGVINWENGVTPTQLGIAQMKAGAAPDAVVKDVKHTGERSQNQRTNASLANARTIANIKESGDNYRKGLDLMKDGWKKENGKWVKPATTQEADQNKAIAMPAILFGEFVQGVAASMNHAKKDNFSIDVNALSQEAYNALGIYDGKDKDGNVVAADKADTKVTFKRDGTYYITKKDGTTKAGTMTSLQQGFINAVAVPEGFQKKSEDAFSAPGKKLWERAVNETKSGAESNQGGGVEFKGQMYSDQQIEEMAAKNGVSKEDYINWLKTQ